MEVAIRTQVFSKRFGDVVALAPLTLLPLGVTVAVLAAASVILAGSRDLAAGVLHARDTRVARTQVLTGPFGLAYRLERGTALGWAAGLAIGGFLLGIITKGTTDVWNKQSGEILGASLGATRWILDTSVFHHISRAPATAVRWDSTATLLFTGIVAAILGAIRFARRDLTGA